LAAFSSQVAVTTAALWRMNTALGADGAAFAGWQIGAYLREQFEVVEKAGIALMGGLHTVAIQIRSEERRVGKELSIRSNGRRRHTRFSRDWSSDVCSSDLACGVQLPGSCHHSRAVENEHGARGGRSSVCWLADWRLPARTVRGRRESRDCSDGWPAHRGDPDRRVLP